jgi:hypothetical protein
VHATWSRLRLAKWRETKRKAANATTAAGDKHSMSRVAPGHASVRCQPWFFSLTSTLRSVAWPHDLFLLRMAISDTSPWPDRRTCKASSLSGRLPSCERSMLRGEGCISNTPMQADAPEPSPSLVLFCRRAHSLSFCAVVLPQRCPWHTNLVRNRLAVHLRRSLALHLG